MTSSYKNGGEKAVGYARLHVSMCGHICVCAHALTPLGTRYGQVRMSLCIHVSRKMTHLLHFSEFLGCLLVPPQLTEKVC